MIIGTRQAEKEVSKDSSARDLIEYLRKRGPVTIDEVTPELNTKLRLYHRYTDAIDKLDAPETGDSIGYSSGTTPVYYLTTDEREAVQKFVEVNHDTVEKSLEGKENELRESLDDDTWEVLKQVWNMGVARNRH